MREQIYSYQLRPLIIPGASYLIIAPLMIMLISYILKISSLEVNLLRGLYILTALGIIAIWVYGSRKSFRIRDNKLIFHTIRGEHFIEPQEIRRIYLLSTKKGQEVVQIKTRTQDYYLNELYFPFPELMADLEGFIRENNIRTNFSLI
ncbi:MAG: hypothetical protein GX958_04295 [Desulfitobacterium sp.]|nr:hypothetical protein [Desulfitobacterium sp.]